VNVDVEASGLQDSLNVCGGLATGSSMRRGDVCPTGCLVGARRKPELVLPFLNLSRRLRMQVLEHVVDELARVVRCARESTQKLGELTFDRCLPRLTLRKQVSELSEHALTDWGPVNTDSAQPGLVVRAPPLSGHLCVERLVVSDCGLVGKTSASEASRRAVNE